MPSAEPSSAIPLFILGAIALIVAGIRTCAYVALGAKGERVGALRAEVR